MGNTKSKPVYGDVPLNLKLIQSNIFYLKLLSSFPLSGKLKWPSSVPLNLKNVLCSKEGVKVLSEYMLSTYCAESILCAVECTQFVKKYNKSLYDNKKQYNLALIDGYIALNNKLYTIDIPKEIALIINMYYLKLYVETEWADYEYIMNKYMKNNSPLQIPCGHQLVTQCLAVSSDETIKTMIIQINSLRKEENKNIE